MNEQPRALLCVLTAVLNYTRRGDSSVTSWKGEKKIVGFSKKKIINKSCTVPFLKFAKVLATAHHFYGPYWPLVRDVWLLGAPGKLMAGDQH